MRFIKRKEAPSGVVDKARAIMDEFIKSKLQLLNSYREKNWEEYVMALQDFIEISEETTIALLQGTNTRPQFVVKSAIRQTEAHVKVLEQQTNRVVVNAFNHPDQAVPLLDS